MQLGGLRALSNSLLTVISLRDRIRAMGKRASLMDRQPGYSARRRSMLLVGRLGSRDFPRARA